MEEFDEDGELRSELVLESMRAASLNEARQLCETAVSSYFEGLGFPSRDLVTHAEQWLWFGGWLCGRFGALHPPSIAEALRRSYGVLAANPQQSAICVTLLARLAADSDLRPLLEWLQPFEDAAVARGRARAAAGVGQAEAAALEARRVQAEAERKREEEARQREMEADAEIARLLQEEMNAETPRRGGGGTPHAQFVYAQPGPRARRMSGRGGGGGGGGGGDAYLYEYGGFDDGRAGRGDWGEGGGGFGLGGDRGAVPELAGRGGMVRPGGRGGVEAGRDRGGRENGALVAAAAVAYRGGGDRARVGVYGGGDGGRGGGAAGLAAAQGDFGAEDYGRLTDLQDVKVPLPQALLRRLPVTTFVPSASAGAAECVVCMDAFARGSEVMALPCIHVFHKSCITQWFLQSKLCPVCKAEVQ